MKTIIVYVNVASYLKTTTRQEAIKRWFKPILVQCHISIPPENVKKPMVF